MKYAKLIPSCKKVIESGRCLGCTALENPNFIGNKNCKYAETPTATDSINRIKKNLRNGGNLK